MSTPLLRWFGGLLIFAVLAGVFHLYTQPDFLFQMANQLWACF
jgi:hypothetical protein